MKILEIYRAAADAEIAVGQKAYMREQFDFLGLKTPVRRALSKDFLKSLAHEEAIDRDLIHTLWAQPEREFQYLAADVLRKMKQLLRAADLPKIKQLVVSKSWWDTVDSLDELVGAFCFCPKKRRRWRRSCGTGRRTKISGCGAWPLTAS